MHEENDVSNRHMTWWRNAWWIRVDSGPHLRTARVRRIWRAARAAEQAQDNNAVGETQRFVEEAEGGGRKTWAKGTTGRRKQHTARRLPLYKPNNPNNRSSRSSNCSDSALAVTFETKFIAKPVVELLAMIDLDLSVTAILTSLMIFFSLRRSSTHLRRVWWVVAPWDIVFCGA